MKRTSSTILLAAGALLAGLVLPGATARADDAPARVDLRVLVVTDGGPATEAIAAELATAGTPYTEIDLTRTDRPVIDAAYLADTSGERHRARFQAVVLPDDNPFPAGSPEMAALAAYERTYGIPQVDAYSYARPEAGLRYPVHGGYSGGLDGAVAQVTDAGRAGPFGYLDGAVPFEDNAPAIGESYGYLSTPADGADFTPYVEAPIPGTTRKGSLIGEYRHDGRRELVVTFVYNRHQQQFRLLARGIVDWMTGGVHLGASRNYFAVHVDDVFAADDRWNTVLDCTPGDVDCADPGVEPDPIRMTSGDVDAAADWQHARGFTLDLAYNGAGSVDHREDHGGDDPLADRLLARKHEFRWINHTYTHAFLGCEQDVSVVPWRCATLPDGTVKWVGRTALSDEIALNRVWGRTGGLPLHDGELVTGEHSGLRVLPQQHTDNPHLGPALADNGVTWLASDNSRESGQRQVGPATTVPRHPMNVFYNAGRAAEQVDEYNWIYTSRAQGGSGICEDNPDTTTCLPAPLDTATGYADHIVPLEQRIALGHVLANDPRPHFIHQSNLAEERIAYPVLDGVLDTYEALHADDTPVVNLRMQDIGRELQHRAAWQAALRAGQVTAYRIGATVTVEGPAGLAAPATLPEGTLRAGAVPCCGASPAAAAPATRVPAGVRTPVPPGAAG
ncbi:hypothetical protein [Streptomyces sp. CC77]|uniref:hypothetical protein n=1 Tax=Streptomyces sp. CC77 TaxID=1906739 RepID=UPI0008DD983A|nr:hypothetical protein [Streptomyces sp. CC77]OII67400.1 hypothetical protein BJP39_25000 [Streptomyces sp. CC77]